MALSSLSFTLSSSANWQATKTATGFANALANNNSPSKKITLGTASANNVAGGSDEVYAAVLSIAASGSTTLDLTSLTDVVNTTAVSFSRIKYYRVHLLSTADDSVNGTNCSGITVGNAASNQFVFNGWGSTATVTVGNGDLMEYGTGNAAGMTVDSTHKSVKIANNDGSNGAAVLLVFVGGTT